MFSDYPRSSSTEHNWTKLVELHIQVINMECNINENVINRQADCQGVTYEGVEGRIRGHPSHFVYSLKGKDVLIIVGAA